MTEQSPLAGRAGTILLAILLIVAGAVALHDTSGYADPDSVAFPRAVASALIVLSIAVVLRALFAGGRDDGLGEGSWVRRLILVASMLGGVVVIPLAGFIAGTALAFAGSLLAAMHDKWSLRNGIAYAMAGAAVVVGFHALFRYALGVPLP